MTSIVCPLCPLHCDDVGIDEQGGLEANGCPIAAAAPPEKNRPPCRGEILIASDAAKPLRVVTTGVDLTTARQLARWQAAGRIDLTFESDPSIEALLQAASRDGIVSATLADAATHADLVWLLGRADQAWPRLAEKLRLGGNGADETKSQRFERCTADDLSRFAAAIESGAGSSSPATGELADHTDTWTSSEYAAVLVGPGAFADGEESLCATMLARLVRQRNTKFRCVLLTLDAAATLRSVCLWTNNTSPSATTEGDQSVGFDIRIGSPLGRDSRAASVQIGGIDPGAEFAAAYRACSVAGLHRPGMVIRGDGSVSLPLAAPVEADLPSSAELLNEILSDGF
ncbi:molybdopterin-binding domain-containing protein [Allorhodopirellula solitaria]|uniref:Formyltransferase/hydrolase complex Fhc subunit B n=1 Tax=Allorhodopirellula solitaria TaxID=2527987 RepID=A0A5C5X0U1_9BACT|nr:formylmethanofuran dehydrogenase [Allorhodopirellula solitaria]TWT56478.1 hypothetical protein CA85_40080 [Allorhodopirellula solitaria]